PCLSTARYRYLQVFPTQDVRLIYPIRSATHLQMRSDALVDLRGITLYPTKAQKDERRLEVPPLEGGFVLLQEYGSRRVIVELRVDYKLMGSSCNSANCPHALQGRYPG